MKTRIKKGDIVKVISGNKEIKGKTGKVLEVLRESSQNSRSGGGDKWRVRVEGLAITKRHMKPQRFAKHPEGGIVEGAGSIPLSNVMLVSEKAGRPVRTGVVFTADGKKQRVARGRGVKSEQV